MNWIHLLACLFFSLSCQAENFVINKANSIKIKVPSLILTFKNKKGQHKISIKGKAELTEKEGNVVIKNSDFESGKKWKEANWQDKDKSTQVVISGPSVPIEVYSSSLSLNANELAHDVFVSARKGQIKTYKTKSNWKILLRDGTFSSEEHEGNVFLQSFHLKASVKKQNGVFDFLFNEGSLSVRGGKGAVNFFTNKASLTMKYFEGSLKANTVSGDVLAFLKPEEVNVESERGKLNFYFRKQGAKVQAFTERGRIYSPRHFNKKYSGRSLKVQGRLKGFPKTGDVFLKTQTGNIYFY